MKNTNSSSKSRFKKGVSGNPAGRPVGSRNKTTLACEQLLEGESEELIRVAVKHAKKGNIHALRLCLERVVPPRKERSIHLELRPISSLQDLPIQFQDIAAAIAEGRITPAEGESISNILTSHAQTMERVEMDRRVAELEAHISEVSSYRREVGTFLQTGAPTDFAKPSKEPGQ
jgi:hypothetical protein